MKVLFKRSVLVKGEHVEAGRVLELENQLAMNLIAHNCCEELKGEDSPIEAREPDIEQRDPPDHPLVKRGRPPKAK